MSKVVAITMGDPAGIGPEIVAKLAACSQRPVAALLIVGDMGTLKRAADIAGVAPAWRVVHGPGALAGSSDVGVLEPDLDLPLLPFGQVDARAGSAAYACILAAVDLALTGEVQAIVTAPLHKEALAAAGISEPGHTEILAKRCGSTRVGMMLASDELRVLLVSVHVSLRQAIEAVTVANEIAAIRLARQACRDLGIEPARIAVAGLNPHAGEGGLFGDEETRLIVPAIARARQEGIDVSGPFPPDTVFMRARRGEFDVVVAQYHDQGLIPVKYLGLEHGVNITVGLPIVRTSVDHGTAFDIAGTGRADAASLAYALRTAIRLSDNRTKVLA